MNDLSRYAYGGVQGWRRRCGCELPWSPVTGGGAWAPKKRPRCWETPCGRGEVVRPVATVACALSVEEDYSEGFWRVPKEALTSVRRYIRLLCCCVYVS